MSIYIAVCFAVCLYRLLYALFGYVHGNPEMLAMTFGYVHGADEHQGSGSDVPPPALNSNGNVVENNIQGYKTNPLSVSS